MARQLHHGTRGAALRLLLAALTAAHAVLHHARGDDGDAWRRPASCAPPAATGTATGHGDNATISHAALILSRALTPPIVARLRELLSVGIDARVVVDRPPAASGQRRRRARGGGSSSSSDAWPPPDVTARVIYIDDAAPRAAGFRNLNYRIMLREVTAWERALWWAALGPGAPLVAASRGAVWLLEDDVGWASPCDLLRLFDSHAADDVAAALDDGAADLVATKAAGSEAEAPAWPHWDAGGALLSRAQYDLAAGFLALSRLSRRLLGALARFAAAHGTLGYLELLVPTLACHAGLRVAWMAASPTLRYPVALRYRPVYTPAELAAAVDATPARVFHPVGVR